MAKGDMVICLDDMSVSIIGETIERLAQSIAAEHLAQGWDPTGEVYDIGSFGGDIGALADALGRNASRGEILELESAVRKLLAPGLSA